MDLEQLSHLYKAYVSGFFQNSYVEPKLRDTDSWTTKLKRDFRSYAMKMYEVDVILLEEVRPEHWVSWTESMILLRDGE